jgi:cystathionine gamma-synthase
MTDDSQRRCETLAAQGMGCVADPYRDIVPPIHVSTTYERGGDGGFPGGASMRARTIRASTRPKR